MSEFYSTSDTALASFLLVSGYILESIDYSKARFDYVFQRTPEIQKSASDYISGNALTDPASFARVNKRLLNTIAHRLQWGDN